MFNCPKLVNTKEYISIRIEHYSNANCSLFDIYAFLQLDFLNI